MQSEISKIMEARKNTREYVNKQVPEEAINAVVRAGTFAEAAERLAFTVVTNPTVRELVIERTRDYISQTEFSILSAKAQAIDFSHVYNAPVVIVISAKRAVSDIFKDINLLCTGCAVQNMLLEATALGLASCNMPATALALNAPDIAAKVGIPQESAVLCAVMLGYSAENTAHKPRPPAKNIRYCK